MLAAIASDAIYTALLRRRPAAHGLSFAAATFAAGAAMLPLYVAEALGGQPPLRAVCMFVAAGRLGANC